MKTELREQVIHSPDDFLAQIPHNREVRNRGRAQRGAAVKERQKKETSSVGEIVKKLEACGYKPIKNHGGVMTQRGRPDIEVLIRFDGLPFAVPFGIEVKRAVGGRIQAQQQYRIDRIIEQGGVAFAATNWETVEEAIERTRQHIADWFRVDDLEGEA